MLKMNVSISIWVRVGAILQSLLVLALSARYAIFPTTLVLAIRFLDTILVALCLRSSHLMDGVIVGENCAQIPDRDGNFSADWPSGENVVIFLLGARSNHALGMFAPGFKQLGDCFRDLSVAQNEGAADNDCKSKPRLASRSLEVRLLLNCPHFAVPGQSSQSITRYPSSSALAPGAASKNYTPPHKVRCIEKTERSRSTTSLPSTMKCTRLAAKNGKSIYVNC